VKFLVKFPPHRRVATIKNLPSFNLRKEGLQVEVVEWIGDLDHFSGADLKFGFRWKESPYVVRLVYFCTDELKLWFA
jgi:hypothetical protein